MEIPSDLIEILDESFSKESEIVLVGPSTDIASQVYELISRESMKKPRVVVVSGNIATIRELHHLATLALIASAEPVVPMVEMPPINTFLKGSQKRKNTTMKPPKYLDNKGLGRKGR